MFEGGMNCIARLSSASDSVRIFGAGIKCLRDGMEAGNFLTRVGFEAAESWNFFEHPLSNFAPDFKFSWDI